MALYAGSFDPPSSGHLDIINRALGICDELVVGIATNPMKNPIFSYDERKHLLEKISQSDRVRVTMVEGLLAEFIKANDIDF